MAPFSFVRFQKRATAKSVSPNAVQKSDELSAECQTNSAFGNFSRTAKQAAGADMLAMDAAGDEYRYEISSACILVRTWCVDPSTGTQAVTGPVRSGQVRSGPVKVRSGPVMPGHRIRAQLPT
jgi:hypothetical protein